MKEEEQASTPSRPKAPGLDERWLAYVPLLGVLLRYQRGDFQFDLVAGLVVAIISVPKSMAYAFLAGLPPQAGLYACLLPMLAYTVLGSSRHLIVGPVAVAALMVAAAIGQHAPYFEGGHMAVTTVICVEAGALPAAAPGHPDGGRRAPPELPGDHRLHQCCGSAHHSEPVERFYRHYQGRGRHPIAALWGLVTDIGSLNPATLLLAVGSLALLWGHAATATGSARESGRRWRARQ